MINEKQIGVDEGFTIRIIRGSLHDLIQESTTSANVNPPLYTSIAYFIFKISSSIFAVKLISVFSGVLTIFIVYLLGVEILDKNTALMAAFLTAVNPLAVFYSQHMRVYAFFTLLAIISIYTAILVAKNEKFLIHLSVLNALLLYAHYIGIIILAAEFLFLTAIYLNKLRKILFSLGMSFVLFLPWLLIVFENFEKLRPGIWPKENLFINFAYLFHKFAIGINIHTLLEHNPLLVVLTPLVCTLFIYGFISIWRIDRWNSILFFFTISLLLSAIVSIKFQIFYYRYLIYLLPLFLLIVSRGINNIKNERIETSVILALLASWLYADMLYYNLVKDASWPGMIGL